MYGLRRQLMDRARSDRFNDESALRGKKRQVVLIAHDVHDSGGMERALAELVRRTSHEFEFCVVSSTLSPDLIDAVRWLRVPIPRRPFIAKFVVFYLLAPLRVFQVRREIRHSMGAIIPNKVDLAAVQFCHAGFLERSEASTSDNSAMSSASYLRRVNDFAHRRMALFAERWSYRSNRLQGFAAASEGIASELLSHYPGHRAWVVRNGVDHSRFRPASADERMRLREQLGLPKDKLIALFVGGDWPRKGLHLAIAAHANANANADGGAGASVLVVVGNGDIARYRAVAGSLGTTDAVMFVGRRDDTEAFYRAADIFLFPTSYEAFPLVAIEAAACGLPIVASPVNGIEELLSDGGAGILCERTVPELSAALRQLIDDSSLRKSMGQAAHRCSLPYSWERHAAEVAEIYVGLRSKEANSSISTFRPAA